MSTVFTLKKIKNQVFCLRKKDEQVKIQKGKAELSNIAKILKMFKFISLLKLDLEQTQMHHHRQDPVDPQLSLA